MTDTVSDARAEIESLGYIFSERSVAPDGRMVRATRGNRFVEACIWPEDDAEAHLQGILDHVRGVMWNTKSPRQPIQGDDEG